jgi:G2/mitotic-specific cyclin 1/2
VANENDENSTATARVTRAKAAATLNVDELAMPTKALQTKKTGLNANPTRARAALGDVSNVAKVNAAEGKKPAGRTGLVSKVAHPAGIQKKTTARSTQAAAKEASKKAEPKRSGPGSIVAQKRKTLKESDTNPAPKKDAAEEGEPARKKVHHTLEGTKNTTTKTDVKQTEATAPKEASLSPAPEAVAPEPRAPVPEAVEILDSEDLDDPLMVAEYANDIFEYLRDLECKSVPNPEYMSHQDDLEWKTRGILIDWLVEVHTRFHLLPETLFLAVNVVDRFLSEKVVQLDRLQLVGITAMFIASKYEEVLSPHIANFRHIADDGFTEAEILSAERFVLATLDYDLSYPNPMNFLRRISKADNYDIQSRTIGKYLMEISLLDHRLLSYRPSHLAAAAMYLARLILGRGEWVSQPEEQMGARERRLTHNHRMTPSSTMPGTPRTTSSPSSSP